MTKSNYNCKPLRMAIKGDRISILGRNFRVKVQKDRTYKSSVIVGQRIIKAYVNGSESTKEVLGTWLREVLGKYIEKKADKLAAKHSLNYKQIRIKSQRSRWGSCSSKKNLNFNWRLVFAPTDVIDYVVAHEMAHLKHMDHSKRFWDYVGEIMPRHKEPLDWLQKNGLNLF